ncbi:Conjugal transfer protein TrbB [Paraburkholderia tropica]|uniref:P-type conjugative transfer ATPase TrbB n=1 Tax=Paraburkholderia tropica TaxID=92647 RepID=UPI001CADB24B|nr:P-type conjugative transfer ATPase TrbB [Paraburkholderia tropica]CAG9229909.1 Conjugal transfer protein TrbB [Paraburkholderia tropica]
MFSNWEPERQSRALEKLSREMGDTILTALADDYTQEVQLNPDGQLWIERFDTGRGKLGSLSSVLAHALLDTIADILGVTVNPENPLLEGELPIRDCRFAGAAPPIVIAPAFSIRTPATKIYTLADYVEAGIMTAEQAEILKDAVREGKNILVIGGTGSGKTTLLNALGHALYEESPDIRILLIEDTRELQFPFENKVALRTKVTGDTKIGMQDLLMFSLRMKPDRIIVGEVRGRAAADMLDTWNTGHEGGMGTIHANSAADGGTRLMDMLRQADMPADVAMRKIATSIDLFVSLQKRHSTGGKRRLEEILRLDGVKDGEFVFEALA